MKISGNQQITTGQTPVKKKETDETLEKKDQVQLGSGGESGFMSDIQKLAEKSSKTVHFRTTQNDEYQLGDGFDSSRDIVAFTAREGSSNEPYKFTVTMRDLQPGAEKGSLDTYLLFDLGKGQGRNDLPDKIPGRVDYTWDLAVGAYDRENVAVYDNKGALDAKSIIKGINYDYTKGTVDILVDKKVLRDMGWKDTQGINVHVFTAKDQVAKVTDSIDRPVNKPWTTSGEIGRSVNTDKTLNPERIEDWSGESIYFMLTDRFKDGDTTNNKNVDKSNLGKYHGGDLQGVIDKLDYIDNIGMKSIWITPVMDNQDFFVKEDNTGYHGYWPIDLFKVDEHLGDMDKFKELIDKAHERGIKVLLDLPLNHLAWEHPFRNDPTKQNWFHHEGDVQNWDDPHEAEHGSIFGLPDLAQENPDVYNYLMDVSKFWMKTGIDGFRLDAVKNINFDFWGKYDKDIHAYAEKELGKSNFFLVGECFDGRVDKVNSYQKQDMDSLFDYPLKFTLHEIIPKDGSMKHLAKVLDDGNKQYQSPELMSGFFDNHDTERFLTASHGDKRKLKLALDFLYTINRVPTIYYGTEVSMDATPPPGQENAGWPSTSRKDMEFDKDPDMLAHFTKLNNVRNDSIALKQGSLDEMWVDDQILAFGRNHPEQEAIVVLNNSNDTQRREIPLRPENEMIKDGTKLLDALTGEVVTVKNGKVPAEVGPKQARIFFPVK